VTPALFIYPDGREVCRGTEEGRAEYYRRKRVAWEDQLHHCAACGIRLGLSLAVADHIQPRGMGGGKRDDRQENIQALCWQCNSLKGSRRDYK
jgi:5-methylcytosine-specific restriction endonuclease McrA